GFLSGLDSAASTPDGARRLSTAVDNSDEGLLTNLTSLFGMGNNIGTGPLQSLLGVGGFSELSGNIGRASGLSGQSVSTLIAFLAPIVFAMLKKIKRARGLDASALATLLTSQRGHIAAATHEAMPEDTYAPRAVHTERMADREPETHKSSVGWIVPLALLAGLLGVIWYGASRSAVRAGRDDSGLASQTARARAGAQQMATFETLRSEYQ